MSQSCLMYGVETTTPDRVRIHGYERAVERSTSEWGRTSVTQSCAMKSLRVTTGSDLRLVGIHASNSWDLELQSHSGIVVILIEVTLPGDFLSWLKKDVPECFSWLMLQLSKTGYPDWIYICQRLAILTELYVQEIFHPDWVVCPGDWPSWLSHMFRRSTNLIDVIFPGDWLFWFMLYLQEISSADLSYIFSRLVSLTEWYFMEIGHLDWRYIFRRLAILAAVTFLRDQVMCVLRQIDYTDWCIFRCSITFIEVVFFPGELLSRYHFIFVTFLTPQVRSSIIY
jgi:hypothetical protein